MKPQRHIGLIIFGACLFIAGKVAMLEPGNGSHQDPLGFIHAIRYYIYGIGMLGLVIFLEDVIAEKQSQRKIRKDDSSPPE